MSLESTIIDIVLKLKSNSYKNEAEVTNGIVLRILNELNWPSYDTGKVKPQYNINNNYVDLVLCCPDNAPITIIEIKALGKGNDVDGQILKYAFDLGTPFAIFTDGQEWHLYLPAAKGLLIERRFHKIDLLERPANELVEVFKSYLLFSEIQSGRAFKKAESDLNKQYKKKEVEDVLPKAWNNLIEHNDNFLINIISEKVSDIIGYAPTDEQVVEFLQKIKQPFAYSQSITQPIESKNVKKHPNSNHSSKDNSNTIFSPIQRNNPKSLTINGTSFQVRTARDVVSTTIEYFINNHPSLVNIIANECVTRTRKLINLDKYKLYTNRADLSEQHSIQLSNGIYMGTNYSISEYLRFMQKIIEVTKSSKQKIEIIYIL